MQGADLHECQDAWPVLTESARPPGDHRRLDSTRLWGKIKNDTAQTHASLVCDLPAARCRKTPEPIVGGLW
jgi:hypothetical protein